MKFVLAGIIVALAVFVFALYLTLKTRTRDISAYPPFDQVVKKELTLQKDAILIRNYEPYVQENPYLLYDTLDEYIKSGIESGDFLFIDTIQAGTEIRIEKAKTFTGGVSGHTQPYVLGLISVNGTEYPFEYQWGSESTAGRFDGVPERWSFPLAPWQELPDRNSYTLPD